MEAARAYAKDRDAAFCAFVEDGDFSHIDMLSDKWGTVRIPHTDTGAASVYKAVQECTKIPWKVKKQAFVKCVDLGFLPHMDMLPQKKLVK